MKNIKTKRIYSNPSYNDGFRILVDRIWPRGVSKENAKLDDWTKNIAPSTKLRKWFGHDPDKFEEFAKKYCEELHEKKDELTEICKMSAEQTITLIYAAKDTKHNHAVVLQNVLKKLYAETFLKN